MITKHFKDLGYTVMARADEYWVDYLVYQHSGYAEPSGDIVYSDEAGLIVLDIFEASAFLTGEVKKDGCSNWNTDCIHGCDRADLVGIGEIMAICWDMTKELLGDKYERST